MVGTPIAAQRRAVSTQIRFGPMRRTAPGVEEDGRRRGGRAIGRLGEDRRTAGRPPDSIQTGVSRTSAVWRSGPAALSAVPGRRRRRRDGTGLDGARRDGRRRRRRATRRPARGPRSAVRRSRMPGHRGPARTGCRRSRRRRRPAGAAARPVSAGMPSASRTRARRDAGRAPAPRASLASSAASVSAESTNPLTSSQPSGSTCGSGVAVEAVARALHAGEGPLLADEARPRAGAAHRTRSSMAAPAVDRPEGDEAAEAETDDARAARRRGCARQPAGGAVDRVDPGAEAIRVAGRAGAVAGPGQVEPERRDGRPAARSSAHVAARPVGRDVVPAPRRQQDQPRDRSALAPAATCTIAKHRAAERRRDRAAGAAIGAHAGRSSAGSRRRPAQVGAP